jgi:glucosylceramidase
MGYFSLGHFSKFVEPNSYRIQSNTFENQLESVAFLNPDKSIVVIISNRESGQKRVKIQWNVKSFEVDLSGLSVSTFKFNS